MTTFYLIRHGQNDKSPGDAPLNEIGRSQAQVTARHLSQLQIDVIYASPLARAQETAQPIADLVGLSIIEDERLRERANYGDLPTQTLAEFVAMWQQCDEDREFVPIVGLSARANGERLEQWLRAVHADYPQGSVIAASHGGTISDFLLNIFPRQNLERLSPGFFHNFGNCSVTIIHFDGERFMLEKLASVDHLVDL